MSGISSLKVSKYCINLLQIRVFLITLPGSGCSGVRCLSPSGQADRLPRALKLRSLLADQYDDEQDRDCKRQPPEDHELIKLCVAVNKTDLCGNLIKRQRKGQRGDDAQ